MKIDVKLQKASKREAIKHVAKKYKLTQAYVKELSGPRPRQERLREIYQIAIKNAVHNWTVELYNREMRKLHLQ